MIAIPQPQLESDWVLKQTSKGVIKNFSIIQIVCSFLAFISEIFQTYGLWYFTIRTGIWAGLIFGINGGIGLFVAKEPTKSNLIALFIMSVISIIFSYVLMIFGFFTFFWNVPLWKIEYFDGIIIGLIQFLIGLVEGGNAIATALLSCHVIRFGR